MKRKLYITILLVFVAQWLWAQPAATDPLGVLPIYENYQISRTRQVTGVGTRNIAFSFELVSASEVTIYATGNSVGYSAEIYHLRPGQTPIVSGAYPSGQNTSNTYTQVLQPGQYIANAMVGADSFMAAIFTSKPTGSAADYANPQQGSFMMTSVPRTGKSTATFNRNDEQVIIQYYDGLGRPNETVQFAANPAKKDLVTYQEYDDYGREYRTWLPVTADNRGAFVSRNTVVSASSSSYANDTKAYSQINYEDSPLNRRLEEYGPGQAWHNNGKASKTEYLANQRTSTSVYGGVLSCMNLEILSAGAKMKEYFPAGELNVIKFTDENGSVNLTFRDKLNQIILERKVDENGNPLDTYYVYDALGNLRYVFPPIAAEIFNSRTQVSDADTDIKQYAYIYKYDDRNRCVSKKLPGADWINYIYDRAGRLIFSQDGVQRAKPTPEWTFSIPDAIGRIVLSGTCTGAPNANAINNSLVYANYPQSGTGSFMGYTLSGIALSGYTVLNASYYDHYKFRSLSGFSNSSLAYDTSGVDSKYLTWHGTESSTANHKGLLTGTATALLTGTNPTYLYSVMYYDYRGRVIQSKSTNHLSGGLEKEYVAYNFAGQPEYRLHIHSATGKLMQRETYTYKYDHAGRVTKVTHQLNASSTVTLAEYAYDELGRLQTKKLHGGTLNPVTYKYNVRSWLTDISSNRFTQNLYYNTGHGTAQFGGNISSMTWKAGTETTLRGYKFEYDKLDRLKEAHYGEGSSIASNAGRFTEKVTLYDKHGNIKQIQRYGKTSASTYGLIDNLTLDYTGNQMRNVNDVIASNTVGQTFHFINSDTGTSNEYTYDANGNMEKDLNKNITSIQYNSLNLPKKMELSNTRTATYLYDATGVKLQVAHQGGGISKTTDYCGNVIYESTSGNGQNVTSSKILTEEGYITLSANSTPTYHYYLKDHLGNNRVVLNSSDTVKQVNHYYPFGGLFDQTAESFQNYKYNGKELDRTYGIDLYDYSARYMDGALGRFTTMDPLGELHLSQSPYTYVLNNPLKYIDVNGMDTTYVNPYNEIIHTKSGGEDIKIPVMEDVIVVGRKKQDATGANPIYSLFQIGINSGSAATSSYAGYRYTQRPWGTGYYRTTNGKKYPLSVLKPQANGKYIRGYTGHKSGVNNAKKTVKFMSRAGNALSYISLGFSSADFLYAPSLENSIDVGAGVLGIIFWEFGAAYAAGSTLIDCGVEQVHQIKSNILQDKYPLSGVYNPTTGHYDY